MHAWKRCDCCDWQVSSYTSPQYTPTRAPSQPRSKAMSPCSTVASLLRASCQPRSKANSPCSTERFLAITSHGTSGGFGSGLTCAEFVSTEAIDTVELERDRVPTRSAIDTYDGTRCTGLALWILCVDCAETSIFTGLLAQFVPQPLRNRRQQSTKRMFCAN